MKGNIKGKILALLLVALVVALVLLWKVQQRAAHEDEPAPVPVQGVPK